MLQFTGAPIISNNGAILVLILPLSFFSAGLKIRDILFIKAAAGIIILFSTARLVLELLWLIRQVHLYFADFGMCTLVEVPLFVSAIIFAAVFDRECLCPRDWQWQVGIAAVFLVWVDLILYMRRMRVLGKLCVTSFTHTVHQSGERGLMNGQYRTSFTFN